MGLPPSFCKAEGPRVGQERANARAVKLRVIGAGRAENRAGERGNVAANRPSRIENRQQWNGNRTERRNEVRDQVRDNHPRLDFWSNNPNWAAWRISRPFRWATWGAMTGWVGYGWSEPTSYSYGENVYYQDDSVYYGDQVVASTEDYTQQAEEIAGGAAKADTEKAEWMPLGVFALTPDGQASGPDPSLFLQLAISKQGIISGTFSQFGHQQHADDGRDGRRARTGVRRGHRRQDQADHGNGHQ